MKQILEQAIIDFGYRKLTEDIYAKPIGYALLCVQLAGNMLKMKSMFHVYSNAEPTVYSKIDIDLTDEYFSKEKGKILYEKYCASIAYYEGSLVKHAMLIRNIKNETYAFRS